jgi:pimeloyl-ACP methyl ester carboxylesterase
VEPSPFEIAVPEDVLADLRDRLARTRLPQAFPDDGWTYGTDIAYLRELVDYWLHPYDWRKQEAELNRLDNFRVTIDDVPLHFVHTSGKGPKPLPLILSHGWPWTFWDCRHVIGPLTDPAAHGGEPDDAFDVVVPSLPGFVFSSPLPRPRIDWQDTSDLWARLMTDVLGYERFGAFGGDWGRAITLQLGHRYAERVIGVHVAGTHRLAVWNADDRPWDIFGPLPAGLPSDVREVAVATQRRYASHVTVQVIDPLTLAAALHDSPAGLCSWLLERRRNWSDCSGNVETRFSKDELLTQTMLYWATDCFADTARFYHYASERRWTPDHDRRPIVEAPTGVTVFLRDNRLPRSDEQLRAEWNLHFRRDHERGGHFCAAEEPQAIIQDLRDFFRPLRTG